MIVNDQIKAANEAVYNHIVTYTKKGMEDYKTTMQDWLSLNQKLWEMSPVKDFIKPWIK